MDILKKIIEPKKSLPKEKQLFTNKRLWGLIYPILVEQALILFVGVADTLIVSYAGESAVSGVSLINQINNVFIIVFTSLASGGAVIVSQYIGRDELHKGCLASGQLIMISTVISITIGAILLVTRDILLRFLFGRIEEDVMDASVTYLNITVLSYPALAIHQACSAIFRSMAKTKITMYVSLLMNIINITGNIIGIFVLKAGVKGVAIPSLLSRFTAALVMFIASCNKKNIVFVQLKSIFYYNKNIVMRILHIAVPNAIEGGMLEGSKVALNSIVALFGTSQIAANGVAQNLFYMASLFSNTMQPVFITVIGQCIGAKDYDAADYYFKKLLKISYAGIIFWNIIFTGIIFIIINFYSLSKETARLVIIMCFFHNLFSMIFHPCTFTLSAGLRATGDVKFIMFTGVFSTAVIRVAFAVILGIWFNLGVIGVTFAMITDWAARGFFNFVRYKSGKWRTFQVI